jgi:nicotinamidase-related amidase
MKDFKLSKEKTGLLLIDVQDKLFSHIDRACEIMLTMQKMIKGFQLMHLPIFVTEQYPQGLGNTIATLKCLLDDDQIYLPKLTFSCVEDPHVKETLSKSGLNQWVLMGIEAHVCVLQTAKDLLNAGYDVVVLNDAISSRSIYDFSTAIAELRDVGVRISSAETVLFELMRSANSPHFKRVSELIKSSS